MTCPKGGTGSFTVVMKITTLEQGPAQRQDHDPRRVPRPDHPQEPQGPKVPLPSTARSSTCCTGDDSVTVNLVDGKLRWKGVSPDGSVVGKGRLKRT